jgi:hypothetical protein
VQIETLCQFCTDQKIFPQAALLSHCIGGESVKTSESILKLIRVGMPPSVVEASAGAYERRRRPTIG